MDSLTGLVLLFFSIYIFLGSCTKDDPENPVFAGAYNDKFIYNEFNPPLSIEIQWDSINFYGGGIDSIDMNMDGIFDLSFSIHTINTENVPSEIKYLIYPNYTLYFKNGIEVAERVETFSTKYNQDWTVYWVDTISLNRRIDKISRWSGGKTHISMYQDYPILYASSGCWSDLTKPIMFIGIRMKCNTRYKYGWIKVEALSRENISFLSYAIEK